MKNFFNITEFYKFEGGDFDAEWVDICSLFGRLVADTK